MVPTTLKRFDIAGGGAAFLIEIEDDKGRTIQLRASRDQLDILADAIDDALLTDDAPIADNDDEA